MLPVKLICGLRTTSAVDHSLESTEIELVYLANPHVTGEQSTGFPGSGDDLYHSLGNSSLLEEWCQSQTSQRCFL